MTAIHVSKMAYRGESPAAHKNGTTDGNIGESEQKHKSLKLKIFTLQSDTRETQEEYYNILHNLRQLLKYLNYLLPAKDHNK
jgi:hypothetical protein